MAIPDRDFGHLESSDGRMCGYVDRFGVERDMSGAAIAPGSRPTPGTMGNVAITGGTVGGVAITGAAIVDGGLASASPRAFRQSSNPPTIALNASALASSQSINSFVSGVLNTKRFGFHGVNPANLKAQNTIFPQNNVAKAANASLDTLGATRFYTSFYYVPGGDAASIDISRYGDSSSVDLFIDDEFVGTFAPAITTGTAQAGAASTITLAAAASATNGFYNQCYARITGGTGSGQIRKISGYVGSTKVATVGVAWTTAPDNTSTYSIEQSPVGIALDASSGSVKYLNLSFPTATPFVNRQWKITLISSHFYGVNIGQTDSVWPAPPVSQMPMMVVGDSYWDGTASPLATPTMVNLLALQMGVQLINLSSGSTGWWTRGTNQRANFLNRIAPPNEAWEVANPNTSGATAGTWTISITYNGATVQSSALAFNAAAAAVESALNGMTFNGFAASNGVSYVGPTGQGCFVVARGDIGSPFVIIANGMAGATISVDYSGITGGTMAGVIQYIGDVAKNIPRDTNGNARPFVLLVPGSGNDTSATGYTTAVLQANALSIAAAIKSKFPTAVPIFTGIVTNSDGGGSGVIGASDLANNAAIKAGANLLPALTNQPPFVDTYINGSGGDCLFTGNGSVGSPTNGKNDIMKSLIAAGHPTGVGAAYLASYLAARVLRILRGGQDAA